MKEYKMNLKKWRINNKNSIQSYIKIFQQVLKIVQLLHKNQITHYDIKADNILMESENPLKVVLADFGTCHIYSSPENENSLIDRGTLYIKSPEMLLINMQNNKLDKNYDRRKKFGTTRASDIWSLGCLLYEITTGEFLFQNENSSEMEVYN